jgi:hypothetical protein
MQAWANALAPSASRCCAFQDVDVLRKGVGTSQRAISQSKMPSLAERHQTAPAIETKSHPTEGRIRYTGIPSRWNGTALKITRHAPRLGEHSVAILREAGIPAVDIDALLMSHATIDGEAMIRANTPAPQGPVAPHDALP